MEWVGEVFSDDVTTSLTVPAHQTIATIRITVKKCSWRFTEGSEVKLDLENEFLALLDVPHEDVERKLRETSSEKA
ncbi:hypothetical protein L5515_001079 [Caenorhabditis briggsae]|uniref:Uncharacterized protein n=1 Tax=Caenorhabditis briggsae TaxID=6238 RepID=A0AAE9J2C9_CAEBR|nr:hypothetical protein L5515_001079 [Caenorhabditis briggsae]